MRGRVVVAGKFLHVRVAAFLRKLSQLEQFAAVGRKLGEFPGGIARSTAGSSQFVRLMRSKIAARPVRRCASLPLTNLMRSTAQRRSIHLQLHVFSAKILLVGAVARKHCLVERVCVRKDYKGSENGFTHTTPFRDECLALSVSCSSSQFHHPYQLRKPKIKQRSAP